MDWGKGGFAIAVVHFVILCVMGFQFGGRFTSQRERLKTFYGELREDLDEATGEGFIARQHRRGKL